MPYITKEDLIQGLTNISPKQVLLINHFYNTFDNRSAANRRIINVEPLFYEGAIAGVEFLTYEATKLYITLECNISSANASATIAQGNFTLYNETNNPHFAAQFQSSGFDGAAVSYVANYLNLQNHYFSRILQGARITWMTFIGYRITLV